MTGAIIFILLFVMLLTGTPISIALGMAVLVFLFTVSTIPVEIISQKLFTGLDSFSIMAIPFFILSGTFLTSGGIATRIVRFAISLVGWMRGGLAMAAVLSCAFFAAISGSSPATVVAIGSIMLPAMVKHGYTKKFAVGVVSTSGGLGILVPPSIVMVIYGVSTSESIGKLFIAGIVPAMIMMFALLGVTYAVARAKGFPTMERASFKEVWQSFRDSVWGLLLVVIVIGGIYGGIFTPTEAAAVSAVYAFVIAVFVYGDLPLKRVPKVLLESANMSAMLLYIITNAMLFSFLLTTENIPQSLAQWIIEQGLTPWMFLLFVNVLLFFAGDFMEPSSIILILAPLFLPVAIKLGIDPIHLGIIMTINMELGMITPPVGLNLYVASGLAKMGLTDVTKAASPWILVVTAVLLLVTYIPQLSLWLPNLMYGGK
ncbi:TRAP transporter large permease [Sulfurirhabdus autotrophica]|uniref:TRAP transporter large permease protein n=1 Tax=Sulfurirhabdus autotrophica TaxID=1706046 RepID=A0A4R3Y6F3_9PROT|nr:TRAP transporter large permease subunit [Sulfurirhabdus autotrophica]TCV87406.1 C4-dicarboxylate transporter DctM subunit [Sulfurirhabdus autotrophica]